MSQSVVERHENRFRRILDTQFQDWRFTGAVAKRVREIPPVLRLEILLDTISALPAIKDRWVKVAVEYGASLSMAGLLGVLPRMKGVTEFKELAKWQIH